MPEFSYMMQEVTGSMMFASGSGTTRALADRQLDRIKLQLDIVPRRPMDYMKLLADVNRRVASKDKTVSPFCYVSFINSDGRFDSASCSFTQRGESVPFEIPLIVSGIDVTELHHQWFPNPKALFKGEEIAVPEIDNQQLNKLLKRKP